MANIKQQVKRIRTSEKSKLANASFKSSVKSAIKAVEAAVIARAEDLKIVTFGNYNTWCDLNLPYDPLLFLSIYDKADYIITNTFHGTVFSILYHKNFVARNKSRLSKLVNQLAA